MVNIADNARYPTYGEYPAVVTWNRLVQWISCRLS